MHGELIIFNVVLLLFQEEDINILSVFTKRMFSEKTIKML